MLRLIGDYAVTVVTTEGPPREPHTASLRLYRTDPAEVFYQPAIDRRRRLSQPLTATLSWGADDTDGERQLTVLRSRRGTLVRDDGGPCFDCGAMQYRIEWTSDGGFGGSWSSASDAILVKGADGGWHSGAAGHFCAWRTTEGGERQPPST